MSGSFTRTPCETRRSFQVHPIGREAPQPLALAEPCPFCECPRIRLRHERGGEHGPAAFAECAKCGARTAYCDDSQSGMQGIAGLLAAAVEQWNKRSAPRTRENDEAPHDGFRLLDWHIPIAGTSRPTPCPFCGTHSVAVDIRSDGGGYYATVECEYCGSNGAEVKVSGFPTSYDAVLQATRSWNHRPVTSAAAEGAGDQQTTESHL